MQQWDYTGLRVTGKYMGEFAISGLVESSRVAYGGEVKHTVVLDEPITVYGALRERVILEMPYVVSVQQ
jgi:hypothetical protein